MAFFMDVIRDSRLNLTAGRDSGIHERTAEPDGEMSPEQEAAAFQPGSEPTPKDSDIRFSRRPAGGSGPAGRSMRGRSRICSGRFRWRTSIAGRERRVGKRLRSPLEGVKRRRARRLRWRIGSSGDRIRPPSSESSWTPLPGRSSDRLPPGGATPTGAHRRRAVLVPAAPERRGAAAHAPHVEPAMPSEIPPGRPEVQTSAHERPSVSEPHPGLSPLREAPPPQPAPTAERTGEAPSGALEPGRPVGAIETRRAGDSNPAGGLPVVRIGRVNVIVESVREAARTGAAPARGEDLAGRTFLRSL